MQNKKTLKTDQNNLIIGGVTASELAAKYGTPLFVFDGAHIKTMCKTFDDAIKKHYGQGLVVYASKAFCAKGIYNILSEFNLGCDVVSGGELYTVKKSNFNLSKVFFHGNNKSFEELKYAIDNDIGYIVIDSISEAKDIEKICSLYNKKQKVLIRVNPGIEAHTHHYIQTAKIDSKFGFSIENGDADAAIKYVINLKNLNLVGLHCHIGSQIFEKKSFVLAVDKMTEYYFYVKNKFNYEFEMINLGGGFGIHYANDDPYLSTDDYDEFIKVIAEELKQNIKKYGLKEPFLVIEPGRSIVGEAGITLYTVGRIKNINGVKNYLSVDGGMFENPRFALYQAVYEAITATKNDCKPCIYYTIAGKCCESGDIIIENAYLPKMEEGDVIAVLSTGAYNYSMASNYNRNLIPPVVIVENGKSEYLIKPQTYDDLIKNDV